ncbi:MAG TPA: biosynthetic arginine decarboxylase [Gemmatimonadales bacterium]|nr:biosynthetic arginine decarboxylase [Gemmatimonadales bacterium]
MPDGTTARRHDGTTARRARGGAGEPPSRRAVWFPRPTGLILYPDSLRQGAIPNGQWTTQDSAKLYNQKGWGLGYFRVNEQGHVTVHPDPKSDRGLDLYDLAMDLSQQGVGLPLLLRFSDILKSRIELLAQEFATAIRENGYEGGYTTVYPIKVNQQRHVVQEIVEFGAPHGVGLECGSKGELQAILGLTESTDHLIVCNGYKDEEFMRLALTGQRLGHRVFIVLEQPSELDTLLRVAEEFGVTPALGVRIKLAAEGVGRWAKSGGEKSKFGLNAHQLHRLCQKLEALGRPDLLKLIHFHLGSQITDIRYIRRALEEIGRFYVELRRRGFEVSHVDVGGGLGVDYDGSRSTRSASVNYSIREYASDIVHAIGTLCRAEELPMPHLISESGRALTAHHSLLLVNVIDVESQVDPVAPDLGPDAHPLLVEMRDNLEVPADRVSEVFHDATFAKERAQELFASGVFSLRDRADAEQLYLCTVNAVRRVIGGDRDAYPEIVAHIEATLVDHYFCNFSVFQSLPDNWAIDQLFPIMPIHRLDERPTRFGTLQDITCDSDGVIDRFVGGRKGKPSLELHTPDGDQPYILGIFLTGAYQEILGDLHNLFGDTNAVHVQFTPTGYEITDLVHGDTVTEVLNYVQFHAPDLLAVFRRKVAAARDLSRQDANSFIADYVAGLEGYTYLEGDIRVPVEG